MQRADILSWDQPISQQHRNESFDRSQRLRCQGQLASWGAAVVAMRRGGCIHAFDTLNHFFLIGQMIIPGSSYWNLGIGRNKGEVEKDEEGIKTMKILGQNMAWLLKKCKVKQGKCQHFLSKNYFCAFILRLYTCGYFSDLNPFCDLSRFCVPFPIFFLMFL